MQEPRQVKVLLVDDERAVLHSTQSVLSELGFRVVASTRAEDVLPLLERERPDVLLQDIRMPGLHIETLLREVRARPHLAHIPVILFSASLDVEEVAERMGLTHTVEKPFMPGELARTIDQAIASS